MGSLTQRATRETLLPPPSFSRDGGDAGERDRQTDRDTDTETETETDRQTDRQRDRDRERETERIERQLN